MVDGYGFKKRVEVPSPVCFEKRRSNMKFDRQLHERVKFDKKIIYIYVYRYFACRKKVISMNHATRFWLTVKAYFLESGSDIPSPRYELALSRKRPKNRIGLNRYYEDYSGEVTRVEDSPPACFEKRRLNIRYDRKLYERVKFNKSYFACRQKVIPMSHATRF